MKFFDKISKNIEILNFIEEKDKNYMGWRGTLRVLRAETWLTVYRTIAIRKQWLSRADLGPHKMINQCKILSSQPCFALSSRRKVLGFLVQNILKIQINVFKCRRDNATAGSMIFQALGKFHKNDNFRENPEKLAIFKFCRRER